MSGEPERKPWQFWIDRGGTFTDCIGVSPEGEYATAKVLSSDTAPVEGVREILSRFGQRTPLLSERRSTAPYGLAGGEAGKAGRNSLRRVAEEEREVRGRETLELRSGDCLRIETPGGGGYGTRP